MCRNLVKVVHRYKENQDCNSVLSTSPGTWPTPLTLTSPSSEGLTGLVSTEVLVVICSLTNSWALVCPCLDCKLLKRNQRVFFASHMVPIKKKKRKGNNNCKNILLFNSHVLAIALQTELFVQRVRAKLKKCSDMCLTQRNQTWRRDRGEFRFSPSCHYLRNKRIANCIASLSQFLHPKTTKFLSSNLDAWKQVKSNARLGTWPLKSSRQEGAGSLAQPFTGWVTLAGS